MANPKKLSYITVDGSGCQTAYYAGQYFDSVNGVLSVGSNAVATALFNWGCRNLF